MTPKYYGDQDPNLHGGALYYPGGPRGYPVRFNGPGRPLLRDADYARLQPVLDFRCQEFRTWEPADVGDYHRIMDRIVNRSWYQLRRHEQYEAGRGWRIWLEWVQVYETPAPDGAKSR